jgi:amino acid transporter
VWLTSGGTITPATRQHQLGVRDLTFFALACVCSARWFPLAAQAGPGSVTLWLVAGLLFMVPLTVAVAALVAKYPAAGGVYRWTREDFGPGHGFLCGWVYWIGIACLFPTAAMLYSQVAISLFGPAIPEAAERIVLVGTTLAMVWTALGANLIGLKIGRWAENLGAVATVALAVVLAVIAALVWTRQGSATRMDIVPPWRWETIAFLAAIAYATSGIEAPGAMAGVTRDPERTMRRAGWTASLLAIALYLIGTVSLLVILPPDQISALNGFADAANAAGGLLATPWLAPLIGALVLLSGVGFIGGSGTATSQLPFAAAADGLLPPAVARLHPRWGTPHVAIIALGLVSTFLLLATQLGDSVQAAFDGLVSLMVITGFLPYLYVFASAWKAGHRVSAVSGTAVTTLAIGSSVVPTEHITRLWLFELKIVVGTVATLGAGWIVYRKMRSQQLTVHLSPPRSNRSSAGDRSPGT